MSTNTKLAEALHPFVLANSSEEHITLVVRTADVARARAALAAHDAEQEPVAWRVWRGDSYELFFNEEAAKRRCECFIRKGKPEPLYAAPTEQAAQAVPADEPTCFGAGDVERLRAAALAVFDGPECSQIARDVIEWFYGTLLVEVGVVRTAPAAPAPEDQPAPADLYVGLIERLMKLSTRLGIAHDDSVEHFAASLEDRLYAICRSTESLLNSLARAAPAQRQPLTDEQIAEGRYRMWAAELEDAPELWAFLKGARWAERYYGIGGATTGEQR